MGQLNNLIVVVFPATNLILLTGIIMLKLTAIDKIHRINKSAINQ